MLQKLLRLPYLLLLIALLLTNYWAAAAVWIDCVSEYAKPIMIVVLTASTLSFFFMRPYLLKLLLHVLVSGSVLVWWLGLQPSNERSWEPEYKNLPSVSYNDDQVTIQNVRNFRYGKDGSVEERWEQRTYDLDTITGVDMFFSHWCSPHIAHTIVSWQFESGPPLSISIETRREQGEEYSALTGFFRQFELYYVVADERDLIELRTTIREEDVYLYRLPTPTPLARMVLEKYLEKIQDLNDEPAWYNAASHNCTTTIRHNVDEAVGANPWSWQLLLNGHLPRLWFESDRFKNVSSFTELQQRSYVSDIGKLAYGREDFSEFIRKKLPPRVFLSE